ncbi:MAG: fimbria/pilus outer membrane usher protein [Nevskia sp.]|nr:fimbria/pilus outer membrane usher protein [Nevskia sp.]
MNWPCSGNERSAWLLGTALLIADPATAGTGDAGLWFAADPCPPDAAQIVALGSQRAVLAVHAHPDQAAEDSVLVRGDDQLWRAPYEAWTQWTPLPPRRIETDASGQRWAVLQPDDGLALRYDSCRSELWVDANPQRLQIAQVDRPNAAPVTVASTGAYLNIDARYGGLSGRNSASGLFDLGAFTDGGAGRSGLYLDRQRVRRLDSHWLIDDPARALRLRLGDSITRSADWETALRFGGVQWGTEFALQPDRITFPLPSIAGNAALASTAQLYVNGVQQSPAQPLQPGAFRFESIPTLTGAGELSVTLRDGLGREQTLSQPFYASPRLLAAGLQEQVLEAGLLRKDYTGPDDRYATPLLAGSLRRGINDRLTVLLRAGSTDRRQIVGGELDVFAAPFGIVTASVAASNSEAGAGAIVSFGFERVDDRYSLSLRRRIASRDYTDFGRSPGAIHFSDAARLSCRMPGGGTASAIYVSEQPWANAPGAGSVRLAGFGWGQPLAARLQAYASWLHTLDGDHGNSVVIGLASAFGTNGGRPDSRAGSAGLQYNNDSSRDGTRASIQQLPAGPLGWAWRGNTDSRDDGLREAEAAWATTHGTFGAGYAGINGSSAPSAFAQTSLAWSDGHGYWARTIRDSFAVIDTGGISGIGVLRENQWAGRSDDHGRLLLTDLAPYQRNRLAIDERDLPIAVSLRDNGAVIAPPAESGVTVRFAVDRRTMQRLRLVDASGLALPAGAQLALDGQALDLPVGYDGLVYLETANHPQSLRALWPDGSCTATIDARSEREALRCIASGANAGDRP